jgi:hypothetical protein
MFLYYATSLLFASLVSGHSWPDNVGGGSYRGSQGANDLVKQRYYCPYDSLDKCAPPANTGVVLSPDSMRPCRTDFPTSPMGSAVSGQPMYIHWAGNGHTNQGAGTCVSVSIAPYALDPDRSAFTQLASCLPFARDGGITDASVIIPANLASGKYTIFWLWGQYGGFWFSGCADINVSGGSSSPTTSFRPATTTSAPTGTTTATSFPPTTTVAAPITSTKSPAPSSDCKKQKLPNTYCQSIYGPSSYCQSWASDKCGYSHCVGETYNDSTC